MVPDVVALFPIAGLRQTTVAAGSRNLSAGLAMYLSCAKTLRGWIPTKV
jgi:hypothetical protein